MVKYIGPKPTCSEKSSSWMQTPDESEQADPFNHIRDEQPAENSTSSIIGYRVELDGPPMTLQRLTMECIRLDQERIRAENALARQREEFIFLRERIQVLEAREATLGQEREREVEVLKNGQKTMSKRLRTVEKKLSDMAKNLSDQEVRETSIKNQLYESELRTGTLIATVQRDIIDIHETLGRITSHVFPDEDDGDNGDGGSGSGSGEDGDEDEDGEGDEKKGEEYDKIDDNDYLLRILEW